MDWSKLAAIRTILLVLAGFTAIAGGVFYYSTGAGLITSGVLAVALAYLTDVQAVRRP